MNSHKYVLNLKLHWVASSIYHSRLVTISLPPTIPVQCLPFSPKILIHHSHLTYPSTILHFSAINRRFGFIEAHQEKHTKSWNEDLLLSKFSSFSQPFLAIASSFLIPSNQYCFVISLNLTFSWFSRNPPHNIIVVLRSKQTLFLHLTTTFVHKISHNIAHIIVSCNLGST